MNYSFQIHNLKHLLKSLLGSIEYAFHGLNVAKGELIVLNYHGVQQKFKNNFKKQIDFFYRHFEFVKLSDLDDIVSGKKKGEKPFLLLTFDDGIKNNFFLLDILDEYKIKGIFFIIPEFVNTLQGEQKAFFLKNIRPQINKKIDTENEDFSSLSWDDLRIIVGGGHIIGSHTMSHSFKKGSKDELLLNYELLNSKKEIESHLGVNISSFCSPNNTLESIGENELRLICINYQYHFTTIPGSNIGASPYFIRRVNVEAHWMNGALLRATGKWDRKRWKKREMVFQKLIDLVVA